MASSRAIVLAVTVAAAPACADDAAPAAETGTTEPGTTEAGSSSDGDASTADASSGGLPPWHHPLCEAHALCDDRIVEAPEVSSPVIVAPNEAFPSEVVSQVAHNNLDVAWHDDRLFLAFRTAPTHFAAPETTMYLVSSPDSVTWDHEATIALGTDVREPQFLALGDELRFFFAVLGDDESTFVPMGTRTIVRHGPGDWSEPVDAYAGDFIAWRMKDEDDTHYVIGYLGGGGIYEPDAPPIEVQVLTTTDGTAFAPAFGDAATVLSGGSSETDFVFTDAGDVIAVSRNEAGDELGFGSKICRAPADDLGSWTCVADPRKYDSPLMFRQGGKIWLVARRNVTDTGWYDLMQEDMTHALQYAANQLAYWNAPKRCALWEVDPEALAVTHVLDLPSRGDTCFPEHIALSPTQVLVFNYTSPLEGDEDPIWRDGQLAPTEIHYVVLTLPPG